MGGAAMQLPFSREFPQYCTEEKSFYMTSEERHEARYQRRVKRRQERRLELSRSCGDFEDVFSFDNLYRSGHICCRGVAWKSSTQMYRFNLVTNTAATRQALLDGTYKSRGFIEFDLYDRGKMRHIRSIHISERVVQRTLCDKAINPILKPSFIYDNGASTQNKGIDFALNRLTCHLQRHYRRHGSEGYVLLFDFSNYFANAQHWPVSRELAKRVHDVRIRALANECLDNFGPIGYGLGSQISQTAALMLPNKLDHFIKEKLGIKGYARYMDDGYLIHRSKAYLKSCIAKIKEVCESLGITLNLKKTKIKKLTDGFKFLQVRFKLTETGKVLRKMSYESIKKMRRKLAKFKRWNEEGREVVIGGKRIRKIFSLSDICKAFGSWLGHMKRGKNFHAIQRMKSYFKTLFGFHPDNKVKWRAAICT